MKRRLLIADKKTVAERVDIEVKYAPSARAWFTRRNQQRQIREAQESALRESQRRNGGKS